MAIDREISDRFDTIVRKVLSVPHSEIMRREAEYQKTRPGLQGKKRGRKPTDPFLRIGIDVFPDSVIGESCACLSIDIQSARSAPSGEGLRIDVDFLEGLSATSKVRDQILCQIEPFVVGLRELISVGED